MRALKLGVAYFAAVFAIGFVLGTARVLWLVPAIGERHAELLEIPVMIAASYLVARYMLGRIGFALSNPDALVMGMLAFLLLLIAEFTIVLGLRDITLIHYLEQRDPVSGIAYYLSLILFMLMPCVVLSLARRSGSRHH